MTSAEWLNSNDPQPMLDFLLGKAEDRKLRLFACACCRRIWDRMSDNSKAAVREAERCADGEITVVEMMVAAGHAYCPDDNSDGDALWLATSQWSAWRAAMDDAWTAAGREGIMGTADRNNNNNQQFAEERSEQARLLRDIFGNPFPPPVPWKKRFLGTAGGVMKLLAGSPNWVPSRTAQKGFPTFTADPAWLTSTVVAIAQGMYESRDFSAMPILADALQDAGCEDDDVLKHSRSDTPHVRGCFVVDLILGKK